MLLCFNRFKKYYREVVENDLLTKAERADVIKCCFNYTKAIGKGLIETRFKDLSYVIDNLSWVDPLKKAQRKVDIGAVVDRFNNNFFDRAKIVSQFKSLFN